MGAGLVWFVVLESRRREADVDAGERPREAAWLSAALADEGCDVSPEAADRLLELHRATWRRRRPTGAGRGPERRRPAVVDRRARDPGPSPQSSPTMTGSASREGLSTSVSDTPKVVPAADRRRPPACRRPRTPGRRRRTSCRRPALPHRRAASSGTPGRRAAGVRPSATTTSSVVDGEKSSEPEVAEPSVEARATRSASGSAVIGQGRAGHGLQPGDGPVLGGQLLVDAAADDDRAGHDGQDDRRRDRRDPRQDRAVDARPRRGRGQPAALAATGTATGAATRSRPPRARDALLAHERERPLAQVRRRRRADDVAQQRHRPAQPLELGRARVAAGQVPGQRQRPAAYRRPSAGRARRARPRRAAAPRARRRDPSCPCRSPRAVSGPARPLGPGRDSG